MPDTTYSRVVQTTSMTHFEQRNAKKWAKDIVKGINSTQATVPARRPGLRGKVYTYTNDSAPLLVVPCACEATNPSQIVVPRLEGQEGKCICINLSLLLNCSYLNIFRILDIPPSDSEPETGDNSPAPLGQTSITRPAPPNEDDAKSQASTIIEDGDSTSESEGEGNDDGEDAGSNEMEVRDSNSDTGIIESKYSNLQPTECCGANHSNF
jgi:hypothetical protein